MRALLLWCLAATTSALAAPARGTDALVSVGACVAESRLAADRAPVVLRVSPWPGGGAQVTLGVRWDDPLGNTEMDALDARPVGDVVAYAATKAAEPSKARALPVFRGQKDARNKNIGDADENPKVSSSPLADSVAAARAPAPGDVGATVIAIDPGVSLATASAAVETALAVVRSVPRDEEVAVFALLRDPLEREKPLLVADFQSPRLGGLRHVERRTRAFLNAFEKKLVHTSQGTNETNEDRGDARRDDTDTETRRDDSSFLFDSLLGELARWRLDPEGPAARDVVVVAPTTPKTLVRLATTSETSETKVTSSFSVASSFSSSSTGSSSPVLETSIPEGGGWALTLMLADRSYPPRIETFQTGSKTRVSVIATGWGARAAAARATLVRARRRSIARVGVCFGETTSTRGDADRSVVSFRVRVGSDFFRCAVPAPRGVASPFGVSAKHDVTEKKNDAFFDSSRETCSARAAASDAYPYPDAIAIWMSSSQRVSFDAKRSFFKGTHRASLFAKTETEARVQFLSDTTGEALPSFRASVRNETRTRAKSEAPRHERVASEDDDARNGGVKNGALAPPLDATVRFRGVSSLRDCARRKSMKVNLKGQGRFRLAPGSAGDAFLLISMCYDDRYVKSKLVFSLAKRLGAFPHAARYVRVLIENPLRPASSDGRDPVVENEGLYLLVDDPASSLERRFARLETVVRRRNDAKRATEPGKGTPEVKRPKALDLESTYLRRYDRLALVAATCATSEPSLETAPRDVADAAGETSSTGVRCYEALDERLDLEQYFRWTALMTLVGSGDHVDETWFYASDEKISSSLQSRETDSRSERGIRSRYRIHAWDPDDAFQPCHHSGLNALRDPHGLLICAEGDLDKVFKRDHRTYAAYVDALEWTLRKALTAEVLRFVAEVEVFDALRFALVDDATAAGLAELVAANPDARTRRGALADIEGSLLFYAWTLRERRRTLLRRVARYRDFSRGTASDGTKPFSAKRTPARAALRREHARFPFEVDRGVFRGFLDEARRSETTRKMRTTSSESSHHRSEFVFSASVREYRYDAAPGSGFQELVARDVALENRPATRFSHGESKNRSVQVAALSTETKPLHVPPVILPVNAEVTYGNATYRAPPSETRVACFFFQSVSHDGDDSHPQSTERFLTPSLTTRAVSSSDGFSVSDGDRVSDAFRGANGKENATSSSCALRGARVVDARTGKLVGKKDAFDYAAFFAAGDGFVSVRFATKRRRDVTFTKLSGDAFERHGWVPIKLAPGERFETRTALSVFHRDWLPFPGGVLRLETAKE